MTKWVVVARLSHESQNALENMYWGHMTQHVIHITVLSICQHHYGYIMLCTLSSPLSSHDGGIAQLGSSQAGVAGGPFHRSRSCQGLSGLKLIYFCPHHPYLFMKIINSCTYLISHIRPHLLHSFMCFSRPWACLRSYIQFQLHVKFIFPLAFVPQLLFHSFSAKAHACH